MEFVGKGRQYTLYHLSNIVIYCGKVLSQFIRSKTELFLKLCQIFVDNLTSVFLSYGSDLLVATELNLILCTWIISNHGQVANSPIMTESELNTFKYVAR